MDIQIPAGTYIVAVSGGVDSVVLLELLCQLPNLTLIVAHADHGIREESGRDAAFVEKLCHERNLKFVSTELKLGKDASEDEARQARYAFLREVLKSEGARAIITAHHQDDVIETAIMNLLRGTGRRGLTSLGSQSDIIRPLLDISKAQIVSYATEQSITWVEDATNQDATYTRNQIRHGLLSGASDEWKESFVDKLKALRHINAQLDHEIAGLLSYRFKDKAVVDRSWFVKLDHMLACECMYGIVRKLKVSNIDSAMIERLTLALKAARPGSKIDVNGDIFALITKRSLRFQNRKTNKTLSV